MYENAPVALFKSRLSDNKCLQANRLSAQILGYKDVEEFLDNFSVANHYANASDRDKFLREIKKNGRVDNFKVQFIKKDGSLIWVQFSGRLYPEKGIFEGAAIDISAQQKIRTSTHESRPGDENDGVLQ